MTSTRTSTPSGSEHSISMDATPSTLSSAEQDPSHRAGFVAVMGRPNVGKSTLINTLLGQKVAIVSPKPQTTRNRLLGILTRSDAQIIFFDTPGIHAPLHALGEAMVGTAVAALPDSDVVLWVVDGAVAPTEEDRKVAGFLLQLPASIPVLIALNKVDRLEDQTAEQQQLREMSYASLVSQAPCLWVSAACGMGVEALVDRLIPWLPAGPPLYPEDQVTDQQVRFMAAELVREQVLLQLRDEVPHSVAVVVNDFDERSTDLTVISAVIYVERPSQRVIVLGRNGQRIRSIGQSARAQIEALLETRVYLDLWVKVRPKWRKREEELRRLGYPLPKVRSSKGGLPQKRARHR